MEETITTTPTVELDIPSATYEVHVTVVTGISSSSNPGQAYIGKGIMQIDRSGLRIQPVTGKRGLLWVKTEYGANWADVSSLHDRLLTRRKRFKVNLGKTPKGKELLLWVGLRGQSVGRAAELSQVFKKLPSRIIHEKCTKCGGEVVDMLCSSCGRNYREVERQNGVAVLVLGIILFIVGWVLTSNSIKHAKPGGKFFIFYGLIAAGAVFAISGVIKIISGRK